MKIKNSLLKGKKSQQVEEQKATEVWSNRATEIYHLPVIFKYTFETFYRELSMKGH